MRGTSLTNMAATYLTGYRTALQVGTCLVRRWWLPTQSRRPRMMVPPAASYSGSRTETSSAPEAPEVPEAPEYIPKKKAKNPMTKIGYAWMIGLPTGIISFILAKRQVDKNRLKQLKIRQRMKKSNEGAYEGSRYQHPQDVKVDH